MNNPFSLEGKTILVTGASSGIGARCAIDLSKAGARVVMVARNEERLNYTLQQMEGSGHVIYPYDLSNLTDQIRGGKLFVNQVVTQVGKLDGFLHCAGIEKTLPLKLVKPEDYEQIFRVNTLSAFEIIHQLCNKANFNNGVILF